MCADKSWCRLSSYLFGATSNSSYGDAAELSADFIWNQLYNGTIILDTIDLKSCKQSEVVLSYNSGMVIEGLADMATRNDTWAAR